MSKILFALFFTICIITSAQAQFSFEGGLNASNLSIKIDDTKYPTKYALGVSLGMVGALPINDKRSMFLELGAFLQTNGAKVKETPDYPEWDFLMTSITVPINIEYKSGDRCSKRYFFGGGPYIRSNMSARAYTFTRDGKMITDYSDLTIGTDIKQIDLGLGINAGYLGKKHWYIRASYALGLKNNLGAGNEKNRLKQSNAGLTVGYVFRSCKVRNWSKARVHTTNHWRGIKKTRWSTHQRLRRSNGPAQY